MRIQGFIFIFTLCAIALAPLNAATTIKEGPKGIVIYKAADSSGRLEKPLVFDQLTRDQFYANARTPAGLLVHIVSDRVVKIVLFPDPASFPTKFAPEDLDVVKYKIDQIRGLSSAYPEAADATAPQLKFLQDLYGKESTQYTQTVTAAAKNYDAASEKEAFDKKCELMRLDLLANKDNIQRSEEIVKQMRDLAQRSELLRGVLGQWDVQKKQALQLSEEGKTLWQSAQKKYPGCFAPAKELKDIPEFPADFKHQAVDLLARLDQFQSSTQFPQLVAYCRAEIPAYFLLNETMKFVDEARDGKVREAADVAVKARNQITDQQITDTYQEVLAMFKSDKKLIDDLLVNFQQQLTKAKSAEDESTDRELLQEYQKAFDLIPDPKVGQKINALKEKIKNE